MVKNNKRILILISCLLIIFILVAININKSISYSLSYDLDGYSISETYNKSTKDYLFKVRIEEVEFPFIFKMKYTTNRKLIKKIDEEKINDGICIKVTVKNDSQVMCYKDDNYLSRDSLVKKEYKVIDSVNKIKVYSKEYDYYIWNGYGITDLLNNKEYNFLKKENYDNNLTYQVNNYVISPNYDDSHTFNKLYIFDMNTKKIDNMDLDPIHFDMYYLGYIDNKVYLFDKSDLKEYEIDLNKKKVKVVSDSEKAFYYDAGKSDISINKLKYNNISFNYNYLYNSSIVDKNILININRKGLTNFKYVISNSSVSDIIRRNEYDIFYISGENLYKYNIYKGEQLLLNNFEWNFNYRNKIFVY